MRKNPEKKRRKEDGIVIPRRAIGDRGRRKERAEEEEGLENRA
jgi:hypothetical protein